MLRRYWLPRGVGSALIGGVIAFSLLRIWPARKIRSARIHAGGAVMQPPFLHADALFILTMSSLPPSPCAVDAACYHCRLHYTASAACAGVAARCLLARRAFYRLRHDMIRFDVARRQLHTLRWSARKGHNAVDEISPMPRRATPPGCGFIRRVAAAASDVSRAPLPYCARNARRNYARAVRWLPGVSRRRLRRAMR